MRQSIECPRRTPLTGRLLPFARPLLPAGVMLGSDEARKNKLMGHFADLLEKRAVASSTAKPITQTPFKVVTLDCVRRIVCTSTHGSLSTYVVV